MNFVTAKQTFDDALRFCDPQTQPLMWDLAKGLSQMAAGLATLEDQILQLKQSMKR